MDRRNDPLLLPAADLRFFDGGHFVFDEYADAIIETFSP
jgi:hypothetical protein